MIVSLVAAKGSAVTTMMLALTATWPDNSALALEMDPTGGDVAAWFDLPHSPGVLTAAAAAREPQDLRTHAHVLPGGVPIVAAPIRGAEAIGPMTELVRGVLPMTRIAGDITAIIDLGSATSPIAPSLLALSDLAVVVVRQAARSRGMTVGRCVHAAAVAEMLLTAGLPSAVVVVGSSPFKPQDVAAQVGLELAGVIADDPQAAASLAGEPGSRRGSSRSRLLRSAIPVAADLAGRLVSAHVQVLVVAR